MEAENYGTLVKNLRIKNGLTQNQVAEALGVTPGYICNVENNLSTTKTYTRNNPL